MDSLLWGLRWVHVALGVIGLVAFWFPVVARKGGTWHRQAGKVFAWSAYGVLSAAAAAVIIELLQLLQRGQGPQVANTAWAFFIFLGYLTLVTAVMLNHGLAVLRHKRNLTTLRHPLRVAAAWASILGSVFVVAWAVYWQPGNAVLLYALSPVGVLNGWGMLKVLRQPAPQPRQWLLEHLGAMLGCGIAYHTAFAVFGASRLFDYSLLGWTAVVPWLLPTLLGVPAIALWSRHYRRPGVALGR